MIYKQNNEPAPLADRAKDLLETPYCRQINLANQKGETYILARDSVEDDPPNDYCVLYIQGLSSGLKSLDNLIRFRKEILQRTGHDFYTLVYSKQSIMSLHNTHRQKVDDVQSAIKYVGCRYDKIFIVCYSMGVPIAVDAIAGIGDDYRNAIGGVMMVNGAGLIGDDRIDRVSIRVANEILNRFNSRSKRAGKSAEKTLRPINKRVIIGLGSVARFLADALSAGRNSAIDSLGQIASEINIHNLVSDGDRICPPDRVISSMLGLNIATSLLDRADHYTPSNSPGKLTDNIIERLLPGSILQA